MTFDRRAVEANALALLADLNIYVGAREEAVLVRARAEVRRMVSRARGLCAECHEHGTRALDNELR
jgi:hypothetical protein